MLVMSLILLALACLVYLTGRIWLIVNAFRMSLGWGFAVLFLAPLGSIIFRMKNPESARGPFYCGLVAILLYGGYSSTIPKGTNLVSALTGHKAGAPGAADADDA